jgi:xanthine phosphoribosyltransferase
MKELEDRIRADGVVIDNEILKVDSFINHQIDTVFFAGFVLIWSSPSMILIKW